MREDRVLGQGMMTYTAKGGFLDLPITAAVDIQVKKTDNETKRTPTPSAGTATIYTRVDLAGTVTLTNCRAKPVDLEVVRHVLGNITEAGQDGKIEMVNVLRGFHFHAAAAVARIRTGGAGGAGPTGGAASTASAASPGSLTLEPARRASN